MKKILIIAILTISINLQAATSFVDNSVNTSTGGDNTGFTSGGGNNSGFTSGGGNNTGYTSTGGYDIMIGGDGAQGAGLGSESSEIYRTTSYTPPSSSVPKMSVGGIVSWLVDIMNSLVYLILGAALVVFLYGILKLSFVDGQKPEAREQSRKFMFWGIFSLFVMVSVWGLVNVLQLTFFGGGNLILPQLK